MNHRQNFTLCAYWYNRPMTGAEYIEAVRCFLEGISQRFSVFSALHIVTKDGSKPLSLNPNRFGEEIIEQLPKDAAYINKEVPENRDFSLKSLPAVAFSNSFTTGPNPGPTDVCSISFSMGRTSDKPNSVIFDFTSESEDEALFDALFHIVITYWSPNHALLTRQSYGDALSQPVGDIRVGWITYLRNREFARFVPSPCVTESFHEGALIKTLPLIPSREGSEIVPVLQNLRAALEPQGFLANPRKHRK